MTFGTRLKRYRTAKGLTQQALSLLSGVRQSLISELETGTRQDTKGHIVLRLAQALGITVEALYGKDSDEDPYAPPHSLVLVTSRSL